MIVDLDPFFSSYSQEIYDLFATIVAIMIYEIEAFEELHYEDLFLKDCGISLVL